MEIVEPSTGKRLDTMIILLMRRSMWAVITLSLLLSSVGFVVLRKTLLPDRIIGGVMAQIPAWDDRSEREERPHLEAVAEQLDVNEDALLEALGLSSEPSDPQRSTLRPLSEVAEQLGVEESDLIEALGFPPEDMGRPELAP